MPIVPIRPDVSARTRTRARFPVKKPDYEIGYAKPPTHSRFKPGQSGNPKGRPKGAKGLNTIARGLLTEKVTLRTATGPKRVSKMEAAIHKLLEKAFGGDLRALTALLQLYRSSVPDDVQAVPINGTEPLPATVQDEAALAALHDLIRAELLGAISNGDTA